MCAPPRGGPECMSEQASGTSVGAHNFKDIVNLIGKHCLFTHLLLSSDFQFRPTVIQAKKWLSSTRNSIMDITLVTQGE